MSQFAVEQQRPAMRRKSSAQNLLSSFKPSGTSSGSSGTPSIAQSTISSTNTLVYPPPSSIVGSTPVATTPLAREWDSTSLYSDTAPPSTLAQGTSVEYLRDLVQKRIITLNYIRDIHEGYAAVLTNRIRLTQVGAPIGFILSWSRELSWIESLIILL